MATAMFVLLREHFCQEIETYDDLSERSAGRNAGRTAIELKRDVSQVIR
jgi:hypothetical protein